MKTFKIGKQMNLILSLKKLKNKFKKLSFSKRENKFKKAKKNFKNQDIKVKFFHKVKQKITANKVLQIKT